MYGTQKNIPQNPSRKQVPLVYPRIEQALPAFCLEMNCSQIPTVVSSQTVLFQLEILASKIVGIMVQAKFIMKQI